ncbi:hypothetical protein GQ457_01G022730 [Hibiscus cannabinus]
MPWQYSPQQEPSNSMDVELARLDVLLREATYDINNMLQQSTHWDTEILMQEVKEKWEESSPMCGTHLEPPSQEHVDEKECSNELQQRIAMAMIGEPGQSNMTTLREAEKSNASANSEESDARNDITTLLLKHESANYSYQHLPQQSYDDMLSQQDGGAMLMEYEEPSKFGYDCLGDDTLSMVIPSNVGAVPKSLLMEMIENSKEISGCMLEDFKRDGPSLDLHRILEKDCYSNWREQQLPQQRRLHPTKMEDDKNEVIKWLGVDITFPLNIFMPSRILARWRVFMDYKGTRNKYTSMVAQKGAVVSILARFFFGNIQNHPMGGTQTIVATRLATIGVLCECTSKQLDDTTTSAAASSLPPPKSGTRLEKDKMLQHFRKDISGRTGGQNEEKTKTEDILQPTCDPPSASCPTHEERENWWLLFLIIFFLARTPIVGASSLGFLLHLERDDKLGFTATKGVWDFSSSLSFYFISIFVYENGYMPWQYSPQQEPSNSKDVELARLDVLLREATYDINNMLQKSTHWDTEILMQEVKEQWEESSPVCGTHLEPPSQEHVDEKECSNELQQRIAMAMIGEPGQSNMTTLREAEKSNASANSEESNARNDITTLLLKHESVNYSYQHLPQQSYDDMLSQQDGGAMLMEYEEPSKVGYDCLGDDTLSMVIPSNVGAVPKSLLMEMIENSKEISGCMLEDFKRDGPSLDLHRILEEDCYSNWRE